MKPGYERLSELRKKQWADPNGPYRTRARTTKSGPKPNGLDRVVRGYVYVCRPDHPNSVRRYIKRSRVVVEEALGRILASTEHVHHLNGIRDDDRIENLVVVSRAEHNHVHKSGRRTPEESWAEHGGACAECGTTARRHFVHGVCHNCHERARRRDAAAEHAHWHSHGRYSKAGYHEHPHDHNYRPDSDPDGHRYEPHTHSHIPAKR